MSYLHPILPNITIGPLRQVPKSVAPKPDEEGGMGELYGPHIIAGPEDYSGYQGRNRVVLKGEIFIFSYWFSL